jgi:hypothetical protein
VYPAEKPVNEMNRLADLFHFPAMVNAGATINVLAMIVLTWYVEPHHSALAGPWIALVLACNLLPVQLLRLTITATTEYPPLARMDFFRDQHKFSDWVYVAASADMAFWILLTWTVSALHRTQGALYATLTIAFLVTFSPVLLRSTFGSGALPGGARVD